MNTDDLNTAQESPPFSGAQALHPLIDTVPDAIVVIDTHGRILSFSKGAERMFGYGENEIVGENVSVLMPSPDRERHDGYIANYMATGVRRIIGIGRVTTARHRDGNAFPVNLSVGEVMLGEQKVFAGVIRDLTEKRETERQLHTLQAELAHVSRIISMGTLATSIAHELNQPLTAITNYVQSAQELLCKEPGSKLELVHEALDECAKEALRAGQIVRRLRDFISRGETTHQVASLHRLVQEAMALALINGDMRGVDFQTRLDPDYDAVLVDPIQIQQVLVNLLRNALEAMEEVKVRQLVISSCGAAKEMVQISVSDSGPGIEPHIAEKLFHPFVSSKPSGMGLGLSICQTIIGSHGGRIWAEPSELGGTTMSFTIMRAETGEADE